MEALAPSAVSSSAFDTNALQVCQQGIERAKCIIISLRTFALARAGHVKDIDLVLADKIDNQLRGVFGGNLGLVDQLMRPLLLNAKANRLFSATAQFGGVNNDSSIGVFYVL